ncbi:prepilin peptidase [Candidatus Saccharibacteria bacterium]|nr:prepilin peptidase [Candidatus Saccharibacteria bacterium]
MIFIALFVLGLVLGSFVNALVWRLHEQSRSKKKRSNVRLSVLKGRSMCTQCGHELAAKDLVPVISWLWLRGRCRYCNKLISVQYPLVELLTGLLFALMYVCWPLELVGAQIVVFGFSLAYITLFVALAVYDARWYLLPDKLVFSLVGLAIVGSVAMAVLEQDAWRYLVLPALGAALLFGIFWGLYQFSRGEWLGGGDVKLVVALGLIAGSPLHAFLLLFFASLLGTVVSIPLLLKGKAGMKRHIPFGPYLLASAVVVILFASQIIDWYQGLFL